ncbi:MAG: hypothetical protein H5U16_09525 [Roseovarius sp.]|nr:hypothetical protein [Roseovarius sp.]
MTVIATLDGGAGDDTFQIGQIFGSNRSEADGNLLPQDEFPGLRPTTRGWLSNGSSAPLLAQGGTGNDEFRVYSNQAGLRLEGDDDNDLFIARAFAIAATTDYDWNADGKIDQLDLDAALDLLTIGHEEGDLAFETAISGREDEAFLKLALKTGGNYVFDRNGDGGINFLDAYITVGDTTDDVIVLDEDGVARPQIGLGFSIAQALDIRAGGGQDEVRYNVNAPVSIDGGTGFDKVVILGTEFADDIVITDKAIYGAGLNVRYTTVEVIEVDGLEGDDQFFVRSTAFGVAYRVIGGLGSDMINVGGDVTADIITRELEGVSGALDHLVISDDFLYDGLVIDGLDYNVTTDGEGLVVIDEGADGFTAIREGSDPVDSYFVRLARALEAGEVVYVTVSAARAPQDERDDAFANPAPLPDGQGDTMLVSSSHAVGGTSYGAADILGIDALESPIDGDFLREVVIDGQTFMVPQRAVVLRFDNTNWDTGAEVFLHAVDDLRAEGDRVVVVQHSVISPTSADYDAIDVRNVEVQLRDNDTPGVLVRELDPLTGEEDGRTLVVEGDATTGLSDQISVQLSREVEVGDTIVVKLNLGGLTGDPTLTDRTDKAINILSSDGRFDATNLTLTFDHTNWDDAVILDIVAVNDDVAEDPETAVIGFGLNVASVSQAMTVGTWDDGGTDKLSLSLQTTSWVSKGFGIGQSVTLSGIAGITDGTSAVIAGFATGGVMMQLDIAAAGAVLGADPSVTVAKTVPNGAQTVDVNGDFAFPNLRSGIGLLSVEVVDNDTAGSVVLETGRDTVLIPDDPNTVADESVSDSYRLRLTQAPTADVQVAILTDGLADVISVDGAPVSYQEIGGLRPVQVFNGTIEFDGVTLTRGAGSDLGSFEDEGWAEGDLLSIGNDPTVHEVVAVTASTLTLNTGTGLTATVENVILSRMLELETWSGEVRLDLVDGAWRLVRLEAEVVNTANPESDPNFGVRGWLGEGFLEGQRVRISDGTNEIDAKIAIIRGFNDTRDAAMQFTLDPGVDFAAADPGWLSGDVEVTVTRIAAVTTFTPDNYHELQTIALTADPYYEVPTTREGVKIFPVKAHRLADIRGPLAVEGGSSGADRSLTNGVKLPGEADAFLFAIGAQAPESQQIDVLNIYNDGSRADTSGVLTDTMLSGFGMSSDLVFPNVSGPLHGEGPEGAGPQTLIFPGGISFGKVNFGANGVTGNSTGNSTVSTIEVVNLMLGEGNDDLLVEGTLNPAPHVSAENEFTFIEGWNDPDYQFLVDRTDFGGRLVIARDGFNWKGEGFLVGQDLFLVDGHGARHALGRIIGIEDALAYGPGDIDPVTSEPYRDPSDNSLLILDASALPTTLPGDLDLTGTVQVVAEDRDVAQLIDTTVQSVNAGVAVLRWQNVNGAGDLPANREEAGLLEGHLLHVDYQTANGVERLDLRVRKIEGLEIEVEAAGHGDLGLVAGQSLYGLFWVQGKHGGLTVLHGGGNRYINTQGSFDFDADRNELVRLDGRSFAEVGFEVGQVVQLEGEDYTRTILGFADANPDDYANSRDFASWGAGSVMLLSEPLGSGGAVLASGEKEFLVHVADALQTIITREVMIEVMALVPGDDSSLETVVRLTDATDWADLGFVAGGVVFIEGFAGGFGIAAVNGDEIVLLNAALGDCADHDGIATLTITTYDITRSGGQRVGGDHFIVTGGAGPDSPLVIYGDTSQDGIWHSGHSYDRLGLEFGPKPFDPLPLLPNDQNEDDSWVFALANPFDLHGNDIIDASALFANVQDAHLTISVGITAYGGMGDDLIIGSQTGDHLAGGSGNDTIIGQRGTDHIYGDSGFNVNILTRALTVATLDASPAPGADPNTPKADDTFAPVASPVRDPLGNRPADMTGLLNIPGAGSDIIEGNGSGVADGTPDIIFADHGEVIQLVIDPNEPFPLDQKIQTTQLSTVIAINSVQPQTGGDDVVFGSEADDIIIGGAGNDALDGGQGDDLIFGDNVNLTRMGEIDGNLYDDIASLRFQTLAGTMMYSRSDRPAPPGYDLSAVSGPNSGVLMVSLDENGEPIARDFRDPNGPSWWSEYEIDYAEYHSFAVQAGLTGAGSFGNDYIAGGAGNDYIFGQLGNDIIQGDGTIAGAVTGRGNGTAGGFTPLTGYVSAAREMGTVNDPTGALKVVASVALPSDGSDYIEGGGGCDTIFGGLGQDDIVGGSSSFFSLVDPENRPDGGDMIFGGSGERIERNDDRLPGDGTEVFERHARDADAIIGDNGNIVRLVGINGTDLLTVLRHEIGHLLGSEHESSLLMGSDLRSRTRIGVGDTATVTPEPEPGPEPEPTPLDESAPEDGGGSQPGNGKGRLHADAGLVFDPATGTLVDPQEARQLFASRNGEDASRLFVAASAVPAHNLRPVAKVRPAGGTAAVQARTQSPSQARRGLLAELGKIFSRAG